MYYATFIDVLTGIPVPTLEAMMDPRTGLTRRLKWLPSISEVMDFIENWDRRFKVVAGEPLSFGEEKFYDRNGRLRADHTFEPPSPQVRERNMAKLDRLSKIIKETAEAVQRASPQLIQPVQYAGHELDKMRLDALDYLEAMRSAESMRNEDE